MKDGLQRRSWQVLAMALVSCLAACKPNTVKDELAKYEHTVVYDPVIPDELTIVITDPDVSLSAPHGTHTGLPSNFVLAKFVSHDPQLVQKVQRLLFGNSNLRSVCSVGDEMDVSHIFVRIESSDGLKVAIDSDGCIQRNLLTDERHNFSPDLFEWIDHLVSLRHASD